MKKGQSARRFHSSAINILNCPAGKKRRMTCHRRESRRRSHGNRAQHSSSEQDSASSLSSSSSSESSVTLSVRQSSSESEQTEWVERLPAYDSDDPNGISQGNNIIYFHKDDQLCEGRVMRSAYTDHQTPDNMAPLRHTFDFDREGNKDEVLAAERVSSKSHDIAGNQLRCSDDLGMLQSIALPDYGDDDEVNEFIDQFSFSRVDFLEPTLDIFRERTENSLPPRDVQSKSEGLPVSASDQYTSEETSDNPTRMSPLRTGAMSRMYERYLHHHHHDKNTGPSEENSTHCRPNYIEIEDNEWLGDQSKQQFVKLALMPCGCTTSEKARAEGIPACGDRCLNRLTLIECNDDCPCEGHCTNRRFQWKENAPIQPFRTEWKGWGVRAIVDLEPGQFIMEYVGEVVDVPTFLRRLQHYESAGQRDYYFMELDSNFIIDATIKGNMSRLLNHSCEPNCVTQKWTVNGYQRIGMFATRRIQANTELSFDYRYETLGSECTQCKCGSVKCRGVIGNVSKNPVFKAARKTPSISNANFTNNLRQSATSAVSNKKLELPEQLLTESDFLELNKLMIGAKMNSEKMQLLNFMLLAVDVELGRFLMFIEHHGLAILWTWMVDMKVGDNEQDIDLQLRVIEVLEKLPIMFRQEVDGESKMLDLLSGPWWAGCLRWSDHCDDASSVDGLMAIILDHVEKLRDGRVLRLSERSTGLVRAWQRLPMRDPGSGAAAMEKRRREHMATCKQDTRNEKNPQGSPSLDETNATADGTMVTQINLEQSDTLIPISLEPGEEDRIIKIDQSSTSDLRKRILQRAKQDGVIVDARSSSQMDEWLDSTNVSQYVQTTTSTMTNVETEPSTEKDSSTRDKDRQSTDAILQPSHPIWFASPRWPPQTRYPHRPSQWPSTNNMPSQPSHLRQFIASTERPGELGNPHERNPQATFSPEMERFVGAATHGRGASEALIANAASAYANRPTITPSNSTQPPIIGSPTCMMTPGRFPPPPPPPSSTYYEELAISGIDPAFSQPSKYRPLRAPYPSSPATFNATVPMRSYMAPSCLNHYMDPRLNGPPSHLRFAQSPSAGSIYAGPPIARIPSSPQLNSMYHHHHQQQQQQHGISYNRPLLAPPVFSIGSYSHAVLAGESSQIGENTLPKIMTVEQAEICHVLVTDPLTGEKTIVQQIVRKADGNGASPVGSNELHSPTAATSSPASLKRRFSYSHQAQERLWKVAKTTDGNRYYYDKKTRETQWDRPISGVIEGEDDSAVDDEKKNMTNMCSNRAESDDENSRCKEGSVTEKNMVKGGAGIETKQKRKNSGSSRKHSESGRSLPSKSMKTLRMKEKHHRRHHRGISSKQSRKLNDYIEMLKLEERKVGIGKEKQKGTKEGIASDGMTMQGTSKDEMTKEDSKEGSHGSMLSDPNQSEGLGITPTHGKPDESKSTPKMDTAGAATISKSSTNIDKSGRDQFKAKLSKLILHFLTPYLKPNCKIGRITCNADFKYLARKFTHSILEKEEQRWRSSGHQDFEITKRIKVKTGEYITRYMAKCPKEYSRRLDRG